MNQQSALLSHSMTACITAAGLFLGFSVMSYVVSDTLGRLILLNGALSLILLCGLFLAALLGSFLTSRRVSKMAGNILAPISNDINKVIDDPEYILAPAQHTGIAEIDSLSAQIRTLTAQFRRALRQRQRLADIGEGVAKINHDLRNILAATMLVADQLEQSEDPSVKRASPIIIRATEQGAQLCQLMLDYLADMPAADMTLIDVTDIIAGVEAGTSLDVQHDGATNITADKLMFSRLLLNLGRNAKQAGASRLSIDVWTAGHLLVMDISDNGPGLSDAQRGALFTPFSSSNPARTGLGLSICLDLAIAMGGALKLSRTSPEGSEFRLQLPL